MALSKGREAYDKTVEQIFFSKHPDEGATGYPVKNGTSTSFLLSPPYFQSYSLVQDMILFPSGARG